jgi:hypothetical protein
MDDQDMTLGERLGENFRKGVAAQGKAYAEYGAILDQYAKQKIKATDFGRRSVDLYVGAVADVVSAGFGMAADVVQVGVGGLSRVRDEAKAAVEEATARPAAKPAAKAKAD